MTVKRIEAGRYMIEAQARVFWIEKVRNLKLWDLRESKTDGWINDFGSYAEAKQALTHLLGPPVEPSFGDAMMTASDRKHAQQLRPTDLPYSCK